MWTGSSSILMGRDNSRSRLDLGLANRASESTISHEDRFFIDLVALTTLQLPKSRELHGRVSRGQPDIYPELL